MKSSITILGLAAALLVNNANAANEYKAQDVNQQEVSAVSADTTQLQNQLVLVHQEASKKYFGNAEEITAITPLTVAVTNSNKTIIETIAEDKLITEDQEDKVLAFSLERTIQDDIYEANQITGTEVSYEVYPLDFEKINRSVKDNKICPNNMAVSVDLKL